ncbi:threonine/serine exporter family protein [Schumannella luteola]
MVDPAPDEEVEAIGRLGVALLDAGYAVTDVSRVAKAVARSNSAEFTVGALPTGVFVDDGDRTRVLVSTGTSFTFEQVGVVGKLAAEAERGMPWPQLQAGLDHLYTMRPRYPLWLSLLGSGLISGGIAVVLGNPWWAVGLDAALGILVGYILTVAGRYPRIAAVLPFFLALAIALLVGLTASLAGIAEVPFYAISAPLVMLIPGAAVTNALIEVSAGDVVSGGGRLVSGLTIWAMLAAGTVAGVGILGGRLDDTAVVLGPGGGPALAAVDPLFAWPAVALLAIGVGVFLSATIPVTLVITATLLLAYAGTLVLTPLLGAGFAAAVTAAVLLLALRLLERGWPSLPAIVTFRPVFWLLVPGSLGLIAVSSLGSDGSEDMIWTTASTVLGLVIGVQVGAVASEAFRSGPGHNGGRVG